MPASWPGLTFDSGGVCSWCRDHRGSRPRGEEALLALLSGGSGRQHDCVVGVSGGKDSCYMATIVTRRLGLRPLAVFYDHPFVNQLARRNAVTVCERLGIELVVVRTTGVLEVAHVREHLPSVAATGIMKGLCAFCHHGIAATVRGVAAARGIPFILTGATRYEFWELPRPLHRLLGRVRSVPARVLLRFAHTRLRGAVRTRQVRRELRAAVDPSPRQRPGTGARAAPREVAFYDYVAWEHDLIERTLVEEVDWQPPAQTLSWRYDCALEPILDLVLLRRFGISCAGVYLANLVRDGILPRERALGLLAEVEDHARLVHHATELVASLSLPETTLAALVAAS